MAVVRLELVRIGAPLAILGFMSGRLAHADEWLGDEAFRTPDVHGGDWLCPLYLPALPAGGVWAVAATMVVSGLLTALGFRTRWSAAVFTGTLVWVALSDHLTAYTVTKIAPVIMLVVAASPAGSRLGIDAWQKRRRGGGRPKKTRAFESLRFLQLFLPVMYCASGIAKAAGDWLKVPLVLWTQLHDTYQTAVTFALASVMPAWFWTLCQGMVLAFEVFAPVWFAVPRTRPFALIFAVAMHVMIGLMFGPVVWFALLMITLNLASYLPDRWLSPLEVAAAALERRRAHARARVTESSGS
jgi:hypothetical protein